MDQVLLIDLARNFIKLDKKALVYHLLVNAGFDAESVLTSIEDIDEPKTVMIEKSNFDPDQYKADLDNAYMLGLTTQFAPFKESLQLAMLNQMPSKKDEDYYIRFDQWLKDYEIMKNLDMTKNWSETD